LPKKARISTAIGAKKETIRLLGNTNRRKKFSQKAQKSQNNQKLATRNFVPSFLCGKKIVCIANKPQIPILAKQKSSP